MKKANQSCETTQTKGLVPAESQLRPRDDDSDLQDEAATLPGLLPGPALPLQRLPAWAAAPRPGIHHSLAPQLLAAAARPGSQVFTPQPEPCQRPPLRVPDRITAALTHQSHLNPLDRWPTRDHMEAQGHEDPGGALRELRERKRQGEIETLLREKHQHRLAASCMPPTGD
ncbi:hypothetical protein MDA_GLEAN10025322 [Myotis davidii]|uniref:Uncharacterized protein n=1 Tax=Myotis davidii TaxID=225400 RepID=L5M012_MYODS|nr:hypothetical protein MDA_GLEAN10025322 [Myotis davidii]